MEQRSLCPTYKRSSSCTDIIYDVMSSDEEVTDSKDAIASSFPEEPDGEILYDEASPGATNNRCIKSKDSESLPPPILPKIRTGNLEPRILNLSDLDTDKLPVAIEVVEGVLGEEEKNTLYSKDKLVILSRTIISFVSCINTKAQLFNIPIIPSYQIALMHDDKEMNSRVMETVKSILQMKKIPSRIIANTDCQVETVSIVEGQILEVNETIEPNAKYLRVQTLSGEEIKLPKSLKNTFSCCVSSNSLPLPLVIESCVFPQQVVLTDDTCKGRTRKMLCTILTSFVKTFVKVCEYKGDLQSSLDAGRVISELPIETEITFKIIERPNMGMPRFRCFQPQFRPGKSVSRVMMPAEAPPHKPLKQCRSMSDLSGKSIVRSQKNTPPPPQKPKPLLNSCEYERDRKTPPPVKNKPNKAPKMKLDKKAIAKELRSITLENVINYEDTGPRRMPPSPTEETKSNKPKSPVVKGKLKNELAEENKKLRERVSSLESSLSEKEKEMTELELKLNLLETALSSANTTLATEVKRNKQLEMRERSLPPIPGQGSDSASNSPLSPRSQSPMLRSPLSLTTKPKFLPVEPQPGRAKSVSESEGINYEKHTIEYMCSVLDRMNLAQYKEKFMEQGVNSEIFTELEEEVLENELGVKAVLHRKKLLKLAARMKNEDDISHFFVEPQYASRPVKKKEYIYIS